MPVVKPHNQQRNRQRNAKQIKSKKLKSKAQSKLQELPNSHTFKTVSPHYQQQDLKGGETTVNNHDRRNQNYKDAKKTVKKTVNDGPLIKDLKKRLNQFNDQYVPDNLLSILDFLIEKERRDTMAITKQKIRRWREIRNKQARLQYQMRKQLERVRLKIKMGRAKTIKDQIGDSSSLDKSQSQLESGLSSSSNNYSITMKNIEPDFMGSWKDPKKFEGFAFFINQILICCQQSDLPNCIYPCCYIFYMLLISDAVTFDEKAGQEPFSHERSREHIQYYFAVSLFISSKYHEIQPISIQRLIYELSQTLTLRKAEKIQFIALQLNDFRQFYSDHQGRFLEMICLLNDWGPLQRNVCSFILESGLNNPLLPILSNAQGFSSGRNI